MHSESDETLWRYVEGELLPDRARDIETREREYPALRKRIDDIRLIKEELLAGAPEPPAGFVQRVTRSAAALPGTPVIRIDEARRFLYRALVAATILAAVGLALLVFKVLPGNVTPDPLQASPLLGR